LTSKEVITLSACDVTSGNVLGR